MYDLEQALDRKTLAERIKADIDEYAIKTYGGDGVRSHLGASVIGEPCTRKTWYGFRWFSLGVKPNAQWGRMQRLFRRGHLEELRFNEYLRGIGFTVADVTTDGKQFKVAAVGGHFGGSLDGMLRPPERYGIKSVVMLGEYKTKGTGSAFNALKEKGIELTNYQHYTQMCVYGDAYGFAYAIYFAVNKNDDDLHIEVVKLSSSVAQAAITKATDVIMSPFPPPRIAADPNFWQCKTCAYNGVCHRNHTPPQNCRTCQHSKPVEDARWRCSRHDGVITGRTQVIGMDAAGQPITTPLEKVGCASWNPIG